MIHTIRTVAVGDQESKIDSPIILYRGDREVEVEFTINGSKFTFTNGGNVIKSTNATHGQLVINTPTGENMFSEVTECHNGKVVFVITKEMIDELIEVGFYSFQIRLFDESQVSRVTIPPVLKGIDIRNPIAAEDETNVVDIGLVDYAVVVKDEFEDLNTFLPDGNYNKTEWESKDVISGAKLNKIEDALYNINSNMEATDLALLNRVENINKNVYGEVEKLGNELESEVEEFERSLNINVEQFKIDTNAAMTTHKNEVNEELEVVNSKLENVNSKLENVNSQLEHKANKDAVFSMANMGQDVKEAMTGGSVAVVGENTILTENIVDNQVTAEKTNFIYRYKNLFNKKENVIIDNAFINSGNITSNDSYYIIGKIPVESSTTYTLNFLPFGTLTNPSICINVFSSDGGYRYGYSTQTFTTPTNSAYVMITVAKHLYSIDDINEKFMLVKGDTIPETYEPFGYYLDENVIIKNIENERIANNKMCISKIHDGEFQVFVSKYDKDNDLMLMLRKKSGNNLFDFFNWFKIPNSTEVVSTSSNAYTRVQIIGALTDWIAPHIVFAKNNIDGDFPSKDTPKFTGGWHMYNQQTSGDYTPTARTMSIKGFADGVEVAEIGGKYCNNAKIVWVNRIQASNTEKEDGTGREVIEEKITVLFDSTSKCIVKGEITALEDVEYKTYYGIQMYNGINGDIYYLGSRANRGANPKNTSNRSNDKFCNGVVLKGETDTFEMGINTSIDIGCQYANDKEYSALTTTSAKSYMNLINKDDNDNLFVLKEGEKFYWEGYYDIYSTN